MAVETFHTQIARNKRNSVVLIAVFLVFFVLFLTLIIQFFVTHILFLT